MATAELLPDNIRRIAVLVASVDSATARRLLLHLPTSVAKQVRSALQKLGPISSAERQRILADFQATAARHSQTAALQSTATQATTQATTTQATGKATGNLNSAASISTFASPTQPHVSGPLTSRPVVSLAEHSAQNFPQPPANYSRHYDALSEHSAAPDLSQPAWKRMDMRALSHFLRSERPTIIAVVINQLAPGTGVALLQQLPASMHREILLAIANLQDFDAEALQSIEEHLAERLKDYELQIHSEAKGTRRVAALLAAAPPELQETWARFVHIAVDVAGEPVAPKQSAAESREAGVTPSFTVKSALATANTGRSIQPEKPQSEKLQSEKSRLQTTPLLGNSQLENTLGSHVVTTVDVQSSATLLANVTVPEEAPHLIPFPTRSEAGSLSATDHSLIQLEFEQLLALSTHQLAQVLTVADSQCVLLALAGASPAFMKRFYALLSKPDAKALASRLSHIGPLKLRDIDEAQRAITELAANLTSTRVGGAHAPTPPALRVAA